MNWLTWIEACRHGDLQILEQLVPYTEKELYSRYLWQAAVESGKMEMCQWLSKHGRNVNILAFTTAVRTGNLPLLKELWVAYPVSILDNYELYTYLSAAIYTCIGEVGNREMLSWAEENSLQVTDSFVRSIVGYGNVELASALLERGWRFDSDNLYGLGLRNGKQMMELFARY